MLIAEVKTCSPYGFKSTLTWWDLFKLAREHGDAIGVHTQPGFGGSFGLIRTAFLRTDKPIFAKGIHPFDWEVETALEEGASKVIVVGRLPRPDLIRFCIIEPLDLDQIMMVPHFTPVLWNDRNLFTGHHKAGNWKSQFPLARMARPSGQGKLGQASWIGSPEAVHPEADFHIVGEHLIDYVRKL